MTTKKKTFEIQNCKTVKKVQEIIKENITGMA